MNNYFIIFFWNRCRELYCWYHPHLVSPVTPLNTKWLHTWSLTLLFLRDTGSEWSHSLETVSNPTCGEQCQRKSDIPQVLQDKWGSRNDQLLSHLRIGSDICLTQIWKQLKNTAISFRTSFANQSFLYNHSNQFMLATISYSTKHKQKKQ